MKNTLSRQGTLIWHGALNMAASGESPEVCGFPLRLGLSPWTSGSVGLPLHLGLDVSVAPAGRAKVVCLVQ